MFPQPALKRILLPLFILSFVIVRAQSKPVPFSVIDKRAIVTNAVSLNDLAVKLASPYKTDKEKTRSIFRWITAHISYDMVSYRDTTDRYKFSSFINPAKTHEQIYKEYYESIAEKTFRETKGVCEGYARLFKALCDRAGIRCEVISGLIRWRTDNIGEVTNRRHAWNAVFIDNNWKLVDATWASGYVSFETDIFARKFDDFFFLTPPVEFFNDHRPDDPAWSLLPRTPSVQEFFNYPFYFPDFYRSGITGVNHTAGIINVRSVNKEVLIELVTTRPVKDMYIYEIPSVEDPAFNSDTLPILVTDEKYIPPYTINNNKLTYRYKLQSEKAEKIYIMLNEELILAYGIRFVR